MTWFKVDDTFHASRKLNSIPKRYRFPAAGLWAIAGSWVSSQGTDGFVPDYMLDQWGPTEKTVDALVAAGMWERADGGFRFHAWLEYNPSKEQTEADRAAAAARMKRSRERRRAESKSNRGHSDLESTSNLPRIYLESTSNEGHSDHESTANSGHSGHESNEDRRIPAGQGDANEDVTAQRPEVLRRNTQGALRRPDPTRPDPTNKEGVVVKGEVVGGDVFPSPELVDAALDELVAATPATPTPAPTSGQTPDAWSTADAPRCRQHADIPPGDDVPPCRACGSVRQWWQDREAHERDDRRRVVLDCSMCDDRGMIATTDTAGRPVAVVCNHTSPPSPPPAPPTDYRPVSSAETRAAALKAAARKKGPF